MVTGGCCGNAGESEDRWPLPEVDVSEALVEALLLLQPPHNFVRANVEAALEDAQGDPAAALQVRSALRSCPVTVEACSTAVVT